MTKQDPQSDGTPVRTVTVEEAEGPLTCVLTVTETDPAGGEPEVLMRARFRDRREAATVEQRLTGVHGAEWTPDALLDLAAFRTVRQSTQRPGSAVLDVDPRYRLYSAAHAVLDRCDPLGDPESVHRTADDIRRHVIALRGPMGASVEEALVEALKRPPTNEALGRYALALVWPARHVRDFSREVMLLESVARRCTDPAARFEGAMGASRRYQESGDAAADPADREEMLRQSLELWNLIPHADRRRMAYGAALLFKLRDDPACAAACDEVAAASKGSTTGYAALHIKRVLEARAGGRAVVWEDDVPLIRAEEDHASWLGRIEAPRAGLEPGADFLEMANAADAAGARLAAAERSGRADPAVLRELRTDARALWAVTLREWGELPSPDHGPTFADDICLTIGRLSCLLEDYDTAYGAYGAAMHTNGTPPHEASTARATIRAIWVGASAAMTELGFRVVGSGGRALA